MDLFIVRIFNTYVRPFYNWR